MACPHHQLRAEYNRFAVYEPVSIYLKNAPSCHECQVLLQAVEELKPGWIDENNKDEEATIQVVHRIGNRYDVPATVSLRQGDEEVQSFQLFRRSTKEPMYEEVPGRFSKSLLFQTLKVVGDSRSEAAIDRAFKWLSYCLNHDDGCQTPNPEFMPTRLLDVSSSTHSHGMDTILFDPSEPTPYACLSYCWGPDNGDVLKTTRSNVQHHRRAIPFSSLPATIQDAIIVCRGLKIRYLWVDSLCIVQDDENDWLSESAQMRDIYLNSILTIAAEEPSSCKLGFMGTQRFGGSDWQRQLEVDIPNVELFLRPKNSDTGLQSPKCSLDKRAWSLQESVLPRRRLCFNGNEMTWECLGRNICECGHKLWPPQHNSSGTPLKPPFTKPYRDWRRLVEEYSDRSLTHKTDKLSAVSGLANTIAQALEDVEGVSDLYVAGLWRREFVSDLTWRVTSYDTTQDSYSELYRAPSWSWASVDGSVRYELHDSVSKWKYQPIQRMACTVDEVFCQNALPSDPTSPIIAGYAILTGPLALVELVTLNEALATVWVSGAPYGPHTLFAAEQRSLVRAKTLRSVEVFLDRRTEAMMKVEDSAAGCWMEAECKCGSCLDKATAPTDQGRGLFYCLKLFSWTAAGGMDDSGRLRAIPQDTWFLVLQKSTAAGDGFQRRGIGIWRSRFDRWTQRRDEECPVFDKCQVATVKII